MSDDRDRLDWLDLLLFVALLYVIWCIT